MYNSLTNIFTAYFCNPSSAAALTCITFTPFNLSCGSYG